MANLFRVLVYYHDHRDEFGEGEREADVTRRDSEWRTRELLERSEPDAVVGDHAS